MGNKPHKGKPVRKQESPSASNEGNAHRHAPIITPTTPSDYANLRDADSSNETYSTIQTNLSTEHASPQHQIPVSAPLTITSCDTPLQQSKVRSSHT